MLAGAETPTEKIAARHRDRRAYIYIRQSSAKQVQHHGESRRNQYALVERAVALGWAAERVHVIDVDLGQSGQDGSRPGFRELVAEVSLGRVGLVLAYEASRLARNNALCRHRHKAFYAVHRLMPRPGWQGSPAGGERRRAAWGRRHNQRLSRKARRASGARYRPGAVFGGAVRASARSFNERSAWR
jgi:hypothetical protein